MVFCKEGNDHSNSGKDSSIQEHYQKRPSVKYKACSDRHSQKKNNATCIKSTKAAADNLSGNKLPERCR